MKSKLFLPIMLLLFSGSLFASNAADKHLASDTHKLRSSAKKMQKTFKHNITTNDRNHLVHDTKKLSKAVKHFEGLFHKKFWGIVINHNKHTNHQHLLKDFKKVTKPYNHLVWRFNLKTRPHHVVKAFNKLKGRYNHLRVRVNAHFN